ncbi:transposase family protein [Nocardia sp. NPDC049707]|uniref:transposase family protein n=1 Tax=Nocardia sp. NPDC049707 TaxID=3154735 RepID=UPI00343AA561
MEGVAVEGERVVVRARMESCPAVCSRCGVESVRVHSYHDRTVADLPLNGRLVIVRVRVRRPLCSTPQCCRTFREQVFGVLERYQRRTALPRPPAPAPRSRTRCSGAAFVPRDQSARLHRRTQSAAQIPQPRPRRKRPAHALTPATLLLDLEQAHRSAPQAARPPGRTPGRLPADDRPSQTRRRICCDHDRTARQRPRRMDQAGPRSRTRGARPLPTRPRPGQRCRRTHKTAPGDWN